MVTFSTSTLDLNVSGVASTKIIVEVGVTRTVFLGAKFITERGHDSWCRDLTELNDTSLRYLPNRIERPRGLSRDRRERETKKLALLETPGSRNIKRF